MTRALILSILLPALASAQNSSDSHVASLDGPHPVIEIENPKPPSQKPRRKKDPTGPTVQLRYRIVPSTSGVTSARIEIWDRPDLLAKIPVKVAKTGEATWADTPRRQLPRGSISLLSIRMHPRSCGSAAMTPKWSPVSTVAGRRSALIHLRPCACSRRRTETFSLDLDGRFFTPSTKVLLAEPTPKKDIWKVWEFLLTEYIETNKIRVTVPWTYLASSHKLVLWPFNLDEVEAAQGNGLPLNGTEQKTPVGGGAQKILYVANSASPTLRSLEPGQLSADAADRTEAKVVLHGGGFTRSSVVLVDAIPSKKILLEIHHWKSLRDIYRLKRLRSMCPHRSSDFRASHTVSPDPFAFGYETPATVSKYQKVVIFGFFPQPSFRPRLLVVSFLQSHQARYPP